VLEKRRIEGKGKIKRWVVEKCPVKVVDEREEQRLPGRNLTCADDRGRRVGVGQEPDTIHLALITIFARRICKRVHDGRDPEHPLPPLGGPTAIGLTLGLGLDWSDAWSLVVICVCGDC
jgi:hypothetical protein